MSLDDLLVVENRELKKTYQNYLAAKKRFVKQKNTFLDAINLLKNSAGYDTIPSQAEKAKVDGILNKLNLIGG